jgi:hypothetical protein
MAGESHEWRPHGRRSDPMISVGSVAAARGGQCRDDIGWQRGGRTWGPVLPYRVVGASGGMSPGERPAAREGRFVARAGFA